MTRKRLIRISAPVCLLAGMLWLVLARAPAVQATGTVIDCSNDSELIAKLGGGGSVTFNCGPAPVVITVSATLVITANTTIDGGGKVTISGNNAVRA